jgi:hypothetical protein
MSSITIILIVFACVFGGALLVISFRASLPEHHLSADSRDAVMLGVGHGSACSWSTDRTC